MLCFSENMVFRKRNEKNQEALDRAAKIFSEKSADYLLNLAPYGNGKIEIDGEIFSYGWWRWELSENLNHLVLQINQKAGLGFYNNFLSGVKFDKNGKTSLMTPEELGEYD